MPDSRTERASVHGPRTTWIHTAWRLLLALLVLLVLFLDLPRVVPLFLLPTALLLWGAFFVAIATGSLLGKRTALQLADVALALGAYAALAVPGLAGGPARMADALAPVVALTLVPQLGRRDLHKAMHDWALIAALSIYAALAVQALWIWAGTTPLGASFVVIAALLPVLLFEAILRLPAHSQPARTAIVAVSVLLPTLVAIAILLLTHLNRATDPFWSVLFGLIVSLPIGFGLVLALVTKPLVYSLPTRRARVSKQFFLGRAFLELSHGVMLISLVTYIPLGLLR